MQEELRTARDFVLAARSAVRIADKRAAIAACDAACDAACAILHRISQQQSAPAEARVPEAEDEQSAPAPSLTLYPHPPQSPPQSPLLTSTHLTHILL